MSSALPAPMTFEAFLLWEDRQELRYEFDGVAPRAMTGGTIGHDEITFRLRVALDRALAGSRCRARGPNAMIRTTGDRARYPDVLVTCAPVDQKAKVAPDPVVVCEVVSASSSSIDRVVKLREYQDIASVQHYVLLEQDAAVATVISRGEAGWTVQTVGAGGVMGLPALGIEVPLDACYEGMGFSADEAEQVQR